MFRHTLHRTFVHRATVSNSPWQQRIRSRSQDHYGLAHVSRCFSGSEPVSFQLLRTLTKNACGPYLSAGATTLPTTEGDLVRTTRGKSMTEAPTRCPNGCPLGANQGPRRPRRVPRARRRTHELDVHMRSDGVRAADEHALHGARGTGYSAHLHPAKLNWFA